MCSGNDYEADTASDIAEKQEHAATEEIGICTGEQEPMKQDMVSTLSWASIVFGTVLWYLLSRVEQDPTWPFGLFSISEIGLP